jgi:hypothetical protein
MAIHATLDKNSSRWTITHLASGLEITEADSRDQAARCVGLLACANIDFTLSKDGLVERYGSSRLIQLFRETREEVAHPKQQKFLWAADWKAYVDGYEKTDWNAFVLPATV